MQQLENPSWHVSILPGLLRNARVISLETLTETMPARGRQQRVVLYHLSDGFFATQANCSHLFAPLARGKLTADGTVQCPFHRACFDIRTGKVLSWANFPPGIQLLNVMRSEKSLQTFHAHVNGTHVEVDIPAA